MNAPPASESSAMVLILENICRKYELRTSWEDEAQTPSGHVTWQAPGEIPQHNSYLTR
jgi:hypothetical protein